MKVGICFSGQGAQRPGMMKELYDQSDEVKKMYKIAGDVLGRDISELSFYGTREELNSTINTQPCVLAADIAAWMMLKEKGIEPIAFSGFSLGEYAALYAAGCISLEEVFSLIQIRAEAMQEAVPMGQGAMMAINTDKIDMVKKICDSTDKGYVDISNYNSRNQIVISGYVEAVNEVGTVLKEMGIGTSILPVSAPFHCKLMQPAAEVLEATLTKIELKKPHTLIVMNVDAKNTRDETLIKEKLVLQTKCAVRWSDSIFEMNKLGVNTFVECGPGKTLTSFTRRMLSDIKALNVNDIKSFSKTVEAILETDK